MTLLQGKGAKGAAVTLSHKSNVSFLLLADLAVCVQGFPESNHTQCEATTTLLQVASPVGARQYGQEYTQVDPDVHIFTQR